MPRKTEPIVSLHPNLGTCDWGGCNEIAVALRYWADRKINLPVCPAHMTPTIRCTAPDLPAELDLAIRSSGVPRKQICRELGIYQSNLSEMLLGKRRISPERLQIIQRTINLRIILIP